MLPADVFSCKSIDVIVVGYISHPKTYLLAVAENINFTLMSICSAKDRL